LRGKLKRSERGGVFIPSPVGEVRWGSFYPLSTKGEG